MKVRKRKCLMCGECCRTARVYMTEEEYQKVPPELRYLLHRVVTPDGIVLYKVKVRDTETGELVSWEKITEVEDEKVICGALTKDGKCMLHPTKPEICKLSYCEKCKEI